MVHRFVSDAAGVPLNKVTLTTRLEEDLGITGEDAEEFLVTFASCFQVKMDGLEFHKHFGPAGLLDFLFFSDAYVKDYGHYPVTVEHLIYVAQTGEWFDPPRV